MTTETPTDIARYIVARFNACAGRGSQNHAFDKGAEYGRNESLTELETLRAKVADMEGVRREVVEALQPFCQILHDPLGIVGKHEIPKEWIVAAKAVAAKLDAAS